MFLDTSLKVQQKELILDFFKILKANVPAKKGCQDKSIFKHADFNMQKKT